MESPDILWRQQLLQHTGNTNIWRSTVCINKQFYPSTQSFYALHANNIRGKITTLRKLSRPNTEHKQHFKIYSILLSTYKAATAVKQCASIMTDSVIKNDLKHNSQCVVNYMHAQ